MSILSPRRRFLLRASAAALTPLLTRSVASAPPLSSLRMTSASGLMAPLHANRPLLLTASILREPIFPGRSTDLWAYRGGHDGVAIVNPTLRIRSGEQLDVTLANRLGEDTTIHWHGLHVDERNDGSGLHPVPIASTNRYRFKITNRAGLYWYHAHPHLRTGAQVHQGLAGLLLVEDDEEDELRAQLRLRSGDNELALMIQDKLVDRRNNLKYNMGEEDFLGNLTLVNYALKPAFDVRRTLYRLRMLNASNARVYRLAFVRDDSLVGFFVIGSDGGLHAKPSNVGEVFLAPGQRIDMLVDLSKQAPGEIVLRSLPYDPMENEPPGEHGPVFHHELGIPMGQQVDILTLRVSESAADPPAVPATLASLRKVDTSNAQTRSFRLHTDGQRWFINGYNYHDDMQAIAVDVPHNAVEIWEISNDMASMPHPMHLHGFQFQVLTRANSPEQVRRLAQGANGLTPQDSGWNDTVLVWPGETVRIAFDFAHDFRGPQRYMFHCHNLEHEDQGMMMNVRVGGA
jgi:FtsP/CotA-like multicopper oxidase with cupredoxin domain